MSTEAACLAVFSFHKNKKEKCCILRHSSNGWVGYLTNSVLSMVVKVKS